MSQFAGGLPNVSNLLRMHTCLRDMDAWLTICVLERLYLFVLLCYYCLPDTFQCQWTLGLWGFCWLGTFSFCFWLVDCPEILRLWKDLKNLGWISFIDKGLPGVFWTCGFDPQHGKKRKVNLKNPMIETTHFLTEYCLFIALQKYPQQTDRYQS